MDDKTGSEIRGGVRVTKTKVTNKALICKSTTSEIFDYKINNDIQYIFY